MMNHANGTNYRRIFDKKTIDRLFLNTNLVSSLTLKGLTLSVNGKHFYHWGDLGDSKCDHILHIGGYSILVELDVERNPKATLELIQYTLNTNLQKSLLATETLDRYKEINSLFQMSESIRSIRYLEDVADCILEEICKLLPCLQASLWLTVKEKYRRLGSHLQQMQSVLNYDEEFEVVKTLDQEHQIADIFLDSLPDYLSKFSSLPKKLDVRTSQSWQSKNRLVHFTKPSSKRLPRWRSKASNFINNTSSFFYRKFDVI